MASKIVFQPVIATLAAARKSGLLHTWMTAEKKVKMGSKKQNYDFLLALDFEATCEKHGLIEPQEIIEFPCIAVDTKSWQTVATFHQYVRPVHNAQLTNFCTELTGINQSMVEHEPDFVATLEMFQAWLASEKLMDRKWAFVTCGDWDLKIMLPKQCQLASVPVPDHMKHWVNIKKSYHKTCGHFPRSMNNLLQGLGLVFEGRPHSGIDDTRNIVRAIQKLALKGHVFSCC